MNAAELHLMVNHVPLFATIASVVVLVWGIWKNNKDFQHLAMVGFIIAGIFSIIALQSGEAAEEIVEDLAGVTHDIIHPHEEAAETTNWIAIIVAVVALAGFFVDRLKQSFMKTYVWILLVGGLLSAGMFSYTSYLGGHIRHTEIRPDNTPTQTPAGHDEDESGEEVQTHDES